MTPATGCTELIALAYAAATAARELGEPVRFVDGWVSANLMKNGMGVTVPGTGMPGLYIAAAVGALGGGDAECGLAGAQGLDASTSSPWANSTSLTARLPCISGKIHRMSSMPKLSSMAKTTASASVTDDHTNIVFIEKDGKVLRDQRVEGGSGEDPKIAFLHTLTLADIVDFAEQVPIEDLAFLKEAERLNDHLSQEGLTGKYGLKIGYTLQQLVEKGVLADDLSHRIQIRTVAASDARMGGAAFPAMTNSGSGNQGIAATEPVTVVADFLGVTPEKRLRAWPYLVWSPSTPTVICRNCQPSVPPSRLPWEPLRGWPGCWPITNR